MLSSEQAWLLFVLSVVLADSESQLTLVIHRLLFSDVCKCARVLAEVT